MCVRVYACVFPVVCVCTYINALRFVVAVMGIKIEILDWWSRHGEERRHRLFVALFTSWCLWLASITYTDWETQSGRTLSKDTEKSKVCAILPALLFQYSYYQYYSTQVCHLNWLNTDLDRNIQYTYGCLGKLVIWWNFVVTYFLLYDVLKAKMFF